MCRDVEEMIYIEQEHMNQCLRFHKLAQIQPLAVLPITPLHFKKEKCLSSRS